MIYFIQGADGVGLIKIGFTDSPYLHERLQTIQHGSPIPLVCLAVLNGGHRQEMLLHRLFAAQRVYAEWFEPSPRLLRVIEKAKTHASVWHGYRLTFKPRKGYWLKPAKVARAYSTRPCSGIDEWPIAEDA